MKNTLHITVFYFSILSPKTFLRPEMFVYVSRKKKTMVLMVLQLFSFFKMQLNSLKFCRSVVCIANDIKETFVAISSTQPIAFKKDKVQTYCNQVVHVIT